MMSRETSADPTDGELVSRAQQGETGAFENLVRRYADRLHAVVRRLVADDHEART